MYLHFEDLSGTKVSVDANFVDILEEAPTTQYGYIHNCKRNDDGGILYDVQFWISEGHTILNDVPESDVQHFPG